MRTGLGLVGLLTALCLVLPTEGADEKKTDKNDKTPGKTDSSDKPEPKDKPDPKDAKKEVKYIAAGNGTGRLMRMENSNQVMVLSYREQYFENGQPQSRDKEAKVEIAEGVKVRVAEPPLAFDDKGRPRKYTDKEKAEMKGPDKKLWGYTASLENLKPGQELYVYLSRPKDAPKTDPPVATMIYITKDVMNQE